MTDTHLIPQSLIESILAHDVAVSEGDERALVTKTENAWLLNQQAEKYSFLYKAALIYGLATTNMPDDRRKWCHVRFTDAHFSSTWAEFCLAHLEMSEGAVSNYKAIWDLYVRRCEFSFRDLLQIGVSKLVVARKMVATMWPAVDQRLLDALKGNPFKCSNPACGGFVESSDTLLCPHCNNPFSPVEPATYAQLLLLVQQIRNERRALQEDSTVGEPTAKVTADFEVEDGFFRIVPSLQIGEEAYPLPAWEVPVIGDAEINVGIPESILSAGEQALRKLFR